MLDKPAALDVPDEGEGRSQDRSERFLLTTEISGKIVWGGSDSVSEPRKQLLHGSELSCSNLKHALNLSEGDQNSVSTILSEYLQDRCS